MERLQPVFGSPQYVSYSLTSLAEGSEPISEAEEIKEVKTLHARGIQAAKINDFKEALTLFDEALEINEKDAEVLHARSLVGLQMGNFDAALQDAKYLINIEPRSSQGYVVQGLALQYLGRYQEALNSLLTALDFDPQNTDTLTNHIVSTVSKICKIPKSLAKTLKAMDAYRKLSEIGVILFQGTQYEMCAQVLEAAQQFQTNQKGITMRILLTLANAKSKLGLWQQAISLYQECLTIAVATHEQIYQTKALVNIATLHLESGDTHQALLYYHKLLCLEAELLSEAGSTDAMPEFWSKELHRGLHLNMSIAYKTIGNMSAAIMHAQQFVKLVAMHGVEGHLQAESYHNMGVLHEILGDLPAAQHCYEEYLKSSRASSDRRSMAQAYGCLGGMHGVLCNWPLSITYHQQHIAMAEKLEDQKMIAMANEMLGDTYMLKGEYEKAIKQYETVTNSCSHSDFRTKASMLCKMGRGYRALGRNQHSLFCLEQTLAMADDHDFADVRMIAQYHQACILCTSTQLQDIEQAQTSFIKLIPFLEKKISEHEEEKSHCPKEYHDQLSECYDGMLSVLSRLGNKEECLQYAEAHRKRSLTQLPNYHAVCKGVAHYQEMHHEVWTMEHIHRIVSQQNSTVIYYSLLDNALLMWVLQPGIGLVRFYSGRSPKQVSIRTQVSKLLDELLDERCHPDNLTKCENRALPLQNATLRYLQKQNLQQQQVEKVECEVETEMAPRKSPPRQLYDILLAPVEDILLKMEEPRYLTIIPDKELHHCPFAALQDWQGTYVGKRFNLSYVPCMLLLDRIIQNEQTAMRLHDDLDFERSQRCKGGLQRQMTQAGTFSSLSPVINVSMETCSASDRINSRQVSNPRLLSSGTISMSKKSNTVIPAASRETTHLSLLSPFHLSSVPEKIKTHHLPGTPTAPDRMLSAHTYSTLTTRTSTGTDITTSTQVVTTFQQLSNRDTCVVFGAPSLPESVLVHGRPWKSGGHLAAAKRELRMVGEMLDVDPIIGDEATKGQFLREIQEASIIHIATFACLEEGILVVTPDMNQVQFSAEDTSHLITVEDILTCTLHAQLVVISAGFNPARNNFIDARFRLPSLFLAAGAQSVLVCQWQVPDAAAEKFFYSFYHHLQSEGKLLSSFASAVEDLQNDDRFKSVWVWGAFTVIGRDLQVNLKQLQHAKLDQQIDRVEQEVQDNSTKELLNPKSAIPHVESKAENFEKLQQYLLDLMCHQHHQPQVIPALIDTLDAALKRLHVEENNQVTAQLTTEASGSMPAIQLLKRLGFHFQARGSQLTTPYIVFPHWNTDDLLIPAYDALRAVAELASEPRIMKALCGCLPLSQENISLMIDLMSITKHVTEVQLKVRDLSVRPLWQTSHLRQLLLSVGFHQIGLLLAFNGTPRNKKMLTSLLQLLLAMSCYKSQTLLYHLDVNLLGHDSASKSSASTDFAKMPSLTPLFLPRNQLRMSTPWLSTVEHQDEMLEKLRLAKSKSDLSDTLHRQLEHAKSWHQTTVIAQADEALSNYGRPKPLPSKVKVMPGSTASQERVPLTREPVLVLQDVDQRRDYAHHVLRERLENIGGRYREHVMKLFLPYIRT